MRFDHFKKKSSERAVAVVYFALIFSFLMGFLMLAANTGRLVYHKMKLQSSVDLAAYAGASVQASYLGSESPESIKHINAKIMDHYIDLLAELDSGLDYPVKVLPTFPELASCVAACTAANLVNSKYIVNKYHRARDLIQLEHAKVRRILQQMPEAVRAAVEETMRLNMPEFDLEGRFSGAFDEPATRELEDLLKPSGLKEEDPKNAILTFSSQKGAYLANVVAGVPHSFPYFGPACFDSQRGTSNFPEWYCTVNGFGVGGTWQGLVLAIGALAQGLAGGQFSLNRGSVSEIAGMNDNALRLFFIEDPHRPQPFVTVAAEYYPKESFMNLDNPTGGSAFNRRPRLAAVSAAEPFGTLLAAQDYTSFGVKLSGIRKLLLDPRISKVRGDFEDAFKYFEFIGPKDDKGQNIETAEETLKRFLH